MASVSYRCFQWRCFFFSLFRISFHSYIGLFLVQFYQRKWVICRVPIRLAVLDKIGSGINAASTTCRTVNNMRCYRESQLAALPVVVLKTPQRYLKCFFSCISRLADLCLHGQFRLLFLSLGKRRGGRVCARDKRGFVGLHSRLPVGLQRQSYLNKKNMVSNVTPFSSVLIMQMVCV